MDHSVQGYLNRCSSERLRVIAEAFINQAGTDYADSVVLLILNILWSRRERFPANIPPELLQAWEISILGKGGDDCP